MVTDVGPAAASLDVEAILARLDPEQRAAATLPDGPAQIIAPAGSGKTTTMVARLAVLLARGVPPDRMCVVTFNRDAAADLRARVDHQLAAAVRAAMDIEIRTLHALALQVLRDVGEGRTLVADRLPLVRAARRRVAVAVSDPDALPDPAAIDTCLSAMKVERREPPAEARPVIDAYAQLLAARGAIDFDDMVVRAGDLLEMDPRVRQRWQARFTHVCVDEFQDVDAAQLRLVRLLAAPEDNLFVVGDDDQTIYAWRLADVRRILRFSVDYPAARSVVLATNYRCPAPVVEASARMIAANSERFPKSIRPAPGTDRSVGAILATSTAGAGWDDGLARLARTEGDAGRSICVLTRTRAELTPMFVALVRHGVRHRAATPPIVDVPVVTELVGAARSSRDPRHPFHVLRGHREARGWARTQPTGDHLTDDDHAALDAVLGWSTGFRSIEPFIAAFDAARARIVALRDDTAAVELATVHAAKGREWETVLVLGFEADRMPNRRSMADASDPARALEEERRLAYVALTRATRRLILAFDPARPSPFLAEMALATGPTPPAARRLSQEPWRLR